MHGDKSINEDESGELKRELEAKRQKEQYSFIMKFITKRYKQNGEFKQKVFKTSRELASEFEEFTATDVVTMSRAMLFGNFEFVFVGDRPYWVLYDKTIKNED